MVPNLLVYKIGLSALLLILAPLTLYVMPLKAGPDVPQLVGTWQGTNNSISGKKGYLSRPKTIQIIEQKGRRFKGQFKYSDNVYNFLGVIYPDNVSFTWVSTNSNGYNHGRILGKDLISACYVEAGPKATAGCAELKRQ